jgi:hypothetical protein
LLALFVLVPRSFTPPAIPHRIFINFFLAAFARSSWSFFFLLEPAISPGSFARLTPLEDTGVHLFFALNEGGVIGDIENFCTTVPTAPLILPMHDA